MTSWPTQFAAGGSIGIAPANARPAAGTTTFDAPARDTLSHQRTEEIDMSETLFVHLFDADAEAGDLVEVYQHQKPQPVEIWMNLDTGHAGISVNGEPGNAVPMNVWHGVVRTWSLPGPVTPQTANAILEDLRPLLARVLDGSEVRWDGSNHRGILDGDAVDASEEIQWYVEGVEPMWLVYGASEVDEWMREERAAVRAALAAGENPVDIEEQYQGDGSRDNPWIDGLYEWIRDLADA